MIARSRAIALEGLRGAVVDVETHIADGLPAFVLIGLPDTALGEAKDRVRAALQSAGCRLPARRVTTNMSPAALRKHGSGFDLAIAVSILAASGVIDEGAPGAAAHFGELGLDGSVRAAPGVLPVVAAARQAGIARILVPAEAAAEAELVEGIEVVPVASLRQAALGYGADVDDLAPEEPTAAAPRSVAASAAPRREPELADVIGHEEAVRALCVAAAGGHHVLMVGPPGAGKTMLAERLPGILPDLAPAEAIEAAAVRSLRGLPVGGALDARPPFEAPHHTASAIALLGGGSGQLRPGAISLATNGVLFLDEAPEFPRAVLDALRQPLESGAMTIHRASAVATFPARAQLVLAANPCPCGADGAACACSPAERRRYLGRLSGPLRDRIDLQLRVAPLTAAQRAMDADARRQAARRPAREQDEARPDIASSATSGAGAVPPMSSAPERGRLSTRAARALVTAARSRSAARLAGTGWTRNGEVDGAWLREDARRRPHAVADLHRALERGALTMRGMTRALRVAWSIADLEGAEGIAAEHVREALAYRQAAA